MITSLPCITPRMLSPQSRSASAAAALHTKGQGTFEFPTQDRGFSTDLRVVAVVRNRFVGFSSWPCKYMARPASSRAWENQRRVKPYIVYSRAHGPLFLRLLRMSPKLSSFPLRRQQACSPCATLMGKSSHRSKVSKSKPTKYASAHVSIPHHSSVLNLPESLAIVYLCII